MWWLVLSSVVLLFGAHALPAGPGSDLCTYDDLYTSLYDDGQDFCSAMVNTDCEDIETPTQFATYPATQLSSYCDCVVTSCSDEATPTDEGSATETGSRTGSATGTDWITSTSTVAGQTSTASDGMITSTSASTWTSKRSSTITETGETTSTNQDDATSTPTQTGTGTSTADGDLTSTSASSITAKTSDSESATGTGGSSTQTASSSRTGGLSTTKTRASASKTTYGNSDLTSLVSIRPSSVLPSTTRTDAETSETSTDTGSVTGKTDTVNSSTTATASASSASTTSWSTTTTSRTSLVGFTSGSSDGEPNPTQASTATTTTTKGTGESSSSSSVLSDPTSGSTSGTGSSATGGISASSGASNQSTTATETRSSGVASPVITPSSWLSGTSPMSSLTGSIPSGTGPLTSGKPSGTSTFTGWNSSTADSSWGSGSATGIVTIPGTEIGTGSMTFSASRSSFGSGGTIAPTGTWSLTGTAVSSTKTSSPPFLTPPSGFNTSTSHRVSTSFTMPTSFASSTPVANFTQVTRTGAIVKETCYQLPQPTGATRRALLHNTALREQNATIPFPYIESVDFRSDGIDPLFLTLRDAAEGTHYIDVSNRSHIAIVDSLYNAMVLDARGIHFSTKNCRYDVSITIDKMYDQLAKLSGQVCSANVHQRRQRQQRRDNDHEFQQAVFLRDQCDNPVRRTVRKFPLLRVGDTDCNSLEVDDATGRWLFDCTFPGSDSGIERCQSAIRNDVEKFLFTDPFGGSCPDLSTVITTLEATGQDFINPESLRAELYKQGLDATQKGEADLTVVYYEQLWEILKQAFSKLRTATRGRLSAISEYIDVYDTYRNFEDDICEDIHAGDLPLRMSLRAGVTLLEALAELSFAPRDPKPLNATIQDPSKEACCAHGATSVTDGATGMCAYPPSSHIGRTGCVCGTTAAGASIAFEYTECENFVSECAVDADCAKAGHASYVCLTGSCCGGGVCINPYECSQNGTGLVGGL